jgi:signal transduction histidine kinase
MEYESRGYAAQRLITRMFYRSLFGYLLVDAVVMLGFHGPHWMWMLLLAAETVALLMQLSKNGSMIRQVLTPLEALEETADMLGREDAKLSDLRSLVNELGEINAAHLDERLDIPGGQTELAVLAEAINAMLERIEHSYQAQSRFVSDASHELRTPIAVIQGYANMLDRWGKHDPEAGQEAINAIRQEAESMSALVQNLLFLGRVSSGEGGEIIMEEAKKVIAKEFPEYAHIQFRVPDEKFKRHGQAVVAASLPALAK